MTAPTDARPSLLPDLRLCAECGHPASLHYGRGFQDVGFRACMATVDTRPPGAGGDNLTPCKCTGYEPLVKVVFS